MVKSLILRFSDLLDVEYKQGEMVDHRYRVERTLGVGGYGKSYLVYDFSKDRNVVLKSLRLHKRIRKKGRRGFECEAEILAGLQHPSLPEFYRFGEFNGIPYFTMEYINGKTFEQLIFNEGKAYNEIETFTIAEKLIQIIGYIHSSQVVHRDVRIPNVMVQDGDLKLIDFGLARRLNANMEPAKRPKRNRLKDVTVQSDFYGLGHFILFLLYSEYQAGDHEKERSWEEELNLSHFSKVVLRRLLQIEEPYEGWEDIRNDFLKIVYWEKGEKENVIF